MLLVPVDSEVPSLGLCSSLFDGQTELLGVQYDMRDIHGRENSLRLVMRLVTCEEYKCYRRFACTCRLFLHGSSVINLLYCLIAFG